jgi:uncharacterized membrane protein YadS
MKRVFWKILFGTVVIMLLLSFCYFVLDIDQDTIATWIGCSVGYLGAKYSNH